MHPILIDFGAFQLHSYGLAMAAAFGLGIWIAMRRAEAHNITSKFALDLSFYILVFSLLGARFTYVATHWEEFEKYPLDAISPIQHTGKIGIEGLVLLGGVIGGFATAYFYARRKGYTFLQVTDLFIPSLLLGIAVGRLGCFFNGCCFGMPTDVAWCMVFPPESLAGSVFPNTCVHPTQLYESSYTLLLFGGFLWYDRGRHPVGRVTGLFLILYGIGRYYIEGLRWYEQDMILFQSGDFRFTISRLISLCMIAIGVYLVFTRRKAKVANSPSDTQRSQ